MFSTCDFQGIVGTASALMAPCPKSRFVLSMTSSAFSELLPTFEVHQLCQTCRSIKRDRAYLFQVRANEAGLVVCETEVGTCEDSSLPSQARVSILTFKRRE